MTAREKDIALIRRLGARGISLSPSHANTLRRQALTLHRWAEQECGVSCPGGMLLVERDEETGKPRVTFHGDDGRISTSPIPDMETGALRRVRQICGALGIYCYHQTDPRGPSLYLGTTPLDQTNYCDGVAVTGEG